MIQSMTGYGKATAELPDKKINVEIKSLNSKAMDLSTRIAPAYREKEIEIRNEISKVLERGKADFSLWIERKELASAAAKRAHCVFEYIYFARLDSTIDGVKVYDARIRGGKSLAKSYPVEADIVTGVPESGLPAAKGYSEASGIPFAFAFYKNSYIGRTFIKPTQEERESSVHLKLSVLESVVKDKRIVLVDDSIVRGTTIANLIHMLKEAGAKEVHVRISSPPFLHPCYFGTDVPSNDQLIAASHSTEEICKMIGADSLGYMQTDYLEGMAGGLPLCKACFDGNYPMEIPDYTNAEFADIVKC